MRILTILMVLAHVIFSFDTSAAEGVSIGGFRVDGRNLGGIVLPNGAYGSIHQRTEINDLRGGIVTNKEDDRYMNEDGSVYISETEPVIDLPVVSPRNRGFASFKAKELLQQNAQNE